MAGGAGSHERHIAQNVKSSFRVARVRIGPVWAIGADALSQNARTLCNSGRRKSRRTYPLFGDSAHTMRMCAPHTRTNFAYDLGSSSVTALATLWG
jgi:hypothetical protein